MQIMTKFRRVRIIDEAAEHEQYRPFAGQVGVIQSTNNLRRYGETKCYAWVLFESRLTLIPMEFLQMVNVE